MNAKRYTNKSKVEVGYVITNPMLEFPFRTKQAIDKLGQLEDIEEELGIDLITLFNIYNQLCKQRYVYKKFTDTGEVVKVDLDGGYFVIDFKGKQILRIYCGEPSNWYDFKDYGKTWAFTKEDFEK